MVLRRIGSITIKREMGRGADPAMEKSAAGAAAEEAAVIDLTSHIHLASSSREEREE